MSYSFASYREYYLRNIRLAAPIILSQVGQMMVQIADSVMVGQHGPTPLAAVSFGNAVFFILFIFGLGLSMGVTPLVGEKFAAGEHRHSAAYFQNSLLLYFVIGLAITVLQLALVPFMGLMGQEPQVVTLAVPYVRWLALSMFPFMIFAAFKQFLEGLGNTRVAMYIVLGCVGLNILLNYLLINGKSGFEPMGAEGAGLATFISRCCMAAGIIVYFLCRDTFRRYFSLCRWKNFGLGRLRRLLGVGAPISLQMVMEGSAFALSSIMIGWIGDKELAANQVALSVISFAFMMLVGIVSASTVLVSHEVGRRNRDGVRMAAGATYHIAIAYGVLSALLLVAFNRLIPIGFTDDPATIDIASRLLLIYACFELADALQFVSLGILRGMQDVRYTAVVAFVACILFNLPTGYLMGFTLGLGVYGVWLGYAVGLGLAAVLLWLRLRSKMRRLTF
ncbi:MAG: MATE family efflux transporter [Rikenellaceae bacterium]|jgi:MATE family multidrug resistance protein|nr:MATE family efflux transporter [Rikenellaceae bacterium]